MEKISTEALKENNEALVKKYIDMEDISSDEDTIQQGAPRVGGTDSEADVEVRDEVEEALYHGDRIDAAGPPEGIVKQRIGEVSFKTIMLDSYVGWSLLDTCYLYKICVASAFSKKASPPVGLYNL